jgi:hypothetical protein
MGRPCSKHREEACIRGFGWKTWRTDHEEDLDVDVRIIRVLTWILEKQDMGGGLDISGSEQRLVVGSCGHGNEPSGFIKFWNLCG